ncbi:MAG: tetratricopeptide repeat protein [Defluviitaleaceae bacterium]|nr:tetratricopeptide repeat protein [Defluviitaleaceae bacterium]MCL2276087.1 tetratricopeptide repeat protein [Defluviitaleaceae bacterium]
MVSLDARAATFNDEASYWYNRQVGIRAIHTNRKEALRAFLLAEEKGDALNLNNETLYYNIGHCLSDMGFASRAVEYLLKSQDLAEKSGNTSFSVYTRYFLAENYSNVGRHEEALKILKGCLRDEKKVKSAKVTIGLIYKRIARVCFNTQDYRSALENIDLAFNYIDRHLDAYANITYVKANILIAMGSEEKAMACLNDGIALQEEGETEHIILTGRKHLMTLEEEASRQYITTIALPAFEAQCLFLLAIDFYEVLCRHYEMHNKRKVWPYYKRIYELNSMLRKGDIPL